MMVYASFTYFTYNILIMSRSTFSTDPGAFPFGISRAQLRSLRRCLATFAKSTDVIHHVMPRSASRSNKLINCIIEEGVAKVEFLLRTFTVVLEVADLKTEIAANICNRAVFHHLPL